MLSNLNALLITWAITLIIVIGGVTLLELTYDAPIVAEQPEQPDSNPPADDLDDKNTPANSPATEAPTMGQGADIALTAVSTPEMEEKTADGLTLPRIANDGRTALQVYAAKHPVASLQPKIALIMTDVGMDGRLSRDAMRALPAPVTMAISPYVGQPDRWTDEARAGGHETLIMLPMEPYDYPRNNPGDLTLLLGPAVSKDNMKKLRAVLDRTDRYIGLISYMGSSFTTNAEALRPVLTETGSRGLMFVDTRTTSSSAAIRLSRGLGVPSAYSNSFVDEELTEDAIKSRLVALENRARTLGFAVGTIRPKPITIRAVNAWLATAGDRGFSLVPVSAVVDRQPVK